LFQILIDNSDINAIAALYVSIYIGIILKYIWTWSVEYSFIDSQTNPANTKIVHPFFLYKKKCRLTGSIILNRIVKYIRKKECSKDDSEEPVSSLFCTYILSISN
jgi:hypothetical protein